MVRTILALVVGYLTLSVSVVLLYAGWPGGASAEITNQFLACAAMCSLGFATLSGWLTALVARRAPIAHAGGLALLIAVVWSAVTFVSESAEPLAVSLLDLAIGVTGVIAGGWVRWRQMNSREGGEALHTPNCPQQERS